VLTIRWRPQASLLGVHLPLPTGRGQPSLRQGESMALRSRAIRAARRERRRRLRFRFETPDGLR